MKNSEIIVQDNIFVCFRKIKWTNEKAEPLEYPRKEDNRPMRCEDMLILDQWGSRKKEKKIDYLEARTYSYWTNEKAELLWKSAKKQIYQWESIIFVFVLLLNWLLNQFLWEQLLCPEKGVKVKFEKEKQKIIAVSQLSHRLHENIWL